MIPIIVWSTCCYNVLAFSSRLWQLVRLKWQCACNWFKKICHNLMTILISCTNNCITCKRKILQTKLHILYKINDIFYSTNISIIVCREMKDFVFDKSVYYLNIEICLIRVILRKANIRPENCIYNSQLWM